MDLQAVRHRLEGGSGHEEVPPAAWVEALPCKFYDILTVKGLRVDSVEPGRLLCSMRVPSRLVGSGNLLHGGAVASLVDLVGSAVIYSGGATTTGVSLEINVSYMDVASLHDEIEIEAKVLRIGKAVGVAMVGIRNKNGKIIAQGRHTKYLAVSSKL